MPARSSRTDFARRAVQGERLLDIPIVDAHSHLQMHTSFCVRSESIDQERLSYLDAMDATGVDRAVLFTCCIGDYIVLNDVTIAAINFCPERFIGYAFLTLDCAKRGRQELERCRKAGLRGLKLVDADLVGIEQDFMDPQFKQIWDFCAEADWPVLIHGLDIRLLVTPGVRLRRDDVEERIAHRTRSVITLSTPHHGTPLAGFFTTLQGRQVLRLLTVMATSAGGRHVLFLAAQAASQIAAADDRLGLKNTLLDSAADRLLRTLTPGRDDPLWGFLKEVSEDQGAIVQLRIASKMMSELMISLINPMLSAIARQLSRN